MSCPFLQETLVRSCRAAGVRKLIVGSRNPVNDERCSSARFRECPAFRNVDVASKGDACPLLEERHVRYCGAASVPHYVPWSEQAGQCGNTGYRFCDLWLSLAQPHRHDPEVQGISVPRDLWYSPNHLWLQADGAGVCHIGIDAFLARVMSEVDQISFVTNAGVHQPSVVLTVHGMDWALVFPNRLMITTVNTYLRHATQRLVHDPYGAGWLFEGWPVPSGRIEGTGITEGLIQGEQAIAWMQTEVERLSDFVHHLDPATLNDGGTPAAEFLRHLSRDEALRLMHTFFPSRATWGGV
jgi:glycine cleavage system H lipoate-binding protein